MHIVFKNTHVLLLCLIATFHSLSASNLDSLQQLLKKGQNPQEEISLLVEIGKEHADLNDPKSALTIYRKAYSLAKETEDWNGYRKIANAISQVYISTNEFTEAIKTLTALIEEIKPYGKSTLAKAYADLAEVYRRAGYNELAFENHLTALSIHEEEKDTSNIARSLYNIGSIFFYQDNYELALEYYQKTLDISNAANLEQFKFSCLGALGGTYNRMYEVEKSLRYNQEAYELGKKLGLKSGLAYAIMNLGANYDAVGDSLKAVQLYEEALQVHRESNDKWGECGTLRTIGESYMHRGEYDKCIKHLNEAQVIANQMRFRPRLAELYRSISFYYEKIEDYKQSLKYMEKYAMLKDSLSSESSLEKMSDSKTGYEVLKKEKELAFKDAAIASQQRKFLLIGIGILSVGVWLLFRQNRLRAKNNTVLEKKNKQIEKQNEELALAYDLQKETNEKIKEQYRQLEQSNIELKRFAFIASHDLKEPLRSIGSYANLLQRRYKDKIDESANEFLEYITSNTKRLYTLLNDVLDYSKLEVNKQESQLVDANEAIKIANENLEAKIAEKNVQISVGELPEITAGKLHLVQLFQNLIDNSIKYSESQTPTVEIASNEKNGFYEFSVKDNGIGIDPQWQPKIFEMFKRLHNKEKYEGNGIGLAICKKIVQEYGGNIWVESAEGEGSTFYFTFPK